jgi:hypothetical protein
MIQMSNISFSSRVNCADMCLEHEKDAFLEENVGNYDPKDAAPQSHGKMSCMSIGNNPLNRKVGSKDHMCNINQNRICARILKWCGIPPFEHIDQNVHDGKDGK